MSIIETAIRNAKRLAAAGATGEAEPPRKSERIRRPERQAVRALPEAVVSRAFPTAATDPSTMERSAILLGVSDEVAERAYRILRTRVQQRMESQGWRTMAVTAPAAGDGKTVTAINLAVALARDPNAWVFLVDLDLHRPQMAPYLGLQFEKGLSDYLDGKAGFDEVVYDIGVERLAVVPNAKPLERPSDLLASSRMLELCRSLADETPHRLIIYDMPPLTLGDDVLKFSANVDCTLLVVGEGRTPRSALAGCRESIGGERLLGVVLNRSSEREQGGYY